jgi:hypothetical protein
LLPASVTVKTHYYTAAGLQPMEAPVSGEYHVALHLNGKPFLSIICSGSDLDLRSQDGMTGPVLEK